MYSDRSMAYANARAPADKYMEVPEEDEEAYSNEDREGNNMQKKCAMLLVATYGTRDAALAWGKHVAEWITTKRVRRRETKKLAMACSTMEWED